MYERTRPERATAAQPILRRSGPAAGGSREQSSPMLRLVAHELRAHVTVLGGYSELLDDEVVRQDPERCRVALAAMRSHLDSLRDMADHLSRAVESSAPDRLAFRSDRVDLHRVALEAVEFARSVARSRGITLQCELGDLGDGLAQGDRFHLVTAMRNLLENACRYGPPGGTVRLSVARRDGHIEVLVHDQGDGLRLVGDDAFRPFTRGQESGQRAPAGMGLGLSLVAQVAQAHGGVAVWGDDERGGAVIGFRFPAPQPSAGS
ncbi:MAG TPA: HAMP domain-containing sensor histidine kinase [Candidatus Dormibacteraeota bacterium]|nr:HAMP domain-containing sensor histidine kinase [Candidatus Dormibacteraeota bacterium]